MKLKTTLTTTTLASAIALSGSAWAFPIDLDGVGGAVEVTSIDPAPGNAIAHCTGGILTPSPTSPTGFAFSSTGGCGNVAALKLGDIVQNFGHSTVSALLNGTLNVSPEFSGVGAKEWTIIFGFAEMVSSVGTTSAEFITLPGSFGSNFFEIYYHSSPLADSLTGDDFTSATRILAGTILPFDASDGTGWSQFSRSPTTATGNLDQFEDDDYSAIDSVTGSGSTLLKVEVDFQNFAFFKTSLTSLTMTFNSNLNDPFLTVDPSSCFYSTAGNFTPTFLGAGNGYGPCDEGGTSTGSVGPINGTSGPNIMFQQDASIPLPRVIPEPGMLALLGLGFAATGLVNRRRRSA